MAIAQVDHIVEIDAGQNGEDERLQEGDEEFQRGQGDDHAHGQGGDRQAPQAHAFAHDGARAQSDDEAGEDLQRDVAA